MQVKNPTDNKIENIRIKENFYSIEANGTLDNVPEADARYWQEYLHKFLILKKDKEEVKPATIEMPKPAVEEVVEAEEVIEEPMAEEAIVEKKVEKIVSKKK